MSNFFSKLVYCSHLIISSNKVVQWLSWLSKIYLKEKKKITAMATFFILGSLTEQGKRLYRPCSRPHITTILDKINGKPRPPPQIKYGKMTRFYPLRSFILDLAGGRGDEGLLFHFILSKIAAFTENFNNGHLRWSKRQGVKRNGQDRSQLKFKSKYQPLPLLSSSRFYHMSLLPQAGVFWELFHH